MKNKRSMMESEYDIKDIVIIDNGTDTVKVGISGEDYPKLIYDNCCGTPAVQQDNDNANNKPQLLFGSTLKSALNENKSPISLSYPIQDGRIDDLDKIRDFWAYCFEEGLQISELTQVNVLVIDQVKNTKDYKYKLSEILFQDLKVQSVLFMNASTLSLFATGAVTGLSIELGHAVNTVVPIYQGFPLPHALQHSDISGNAISQALLADLKESQITFEQYAELDQRWLIKDIKEHMCYIAQDYERDISQEDYFSEEDKSYQLPDEQIIQITPKIRYRCGESIFNSTILGKNNLTLPEMISDSVGRCDSELQQELCSNIVLGGGSSMYQGLIPRLKKEVQRLLPRISQNYVADFQRMYSPWIGGSMLGSLSTFQSLAITRAEYEENPEGKQSIIHKRTF